MKLRLILEKIYRFLQKKIIPELKYSQRLYEDILNQYISDDIKWLDIGCGHQILPNWRRNEEIKLVKKVKMIIGLDSDIHSLRRHHTVNRLIRANISNLPFRNETFDILTANMVVEHIEYPINQLKEINRVLKPGGLFIFHTPNVYHYMIFMGRKMPEILKKGLIYFLEGRKEEDIFPTFYRLNSTKEICVSAEQTGFYILQTRMIVSQAVFHIITPLAVIELLLIKLLMTRRCREIRPNIIAILKKKDEN